MPMIIQPKGKVEKKKRRKCHHTNSPQFFNFIYIYIYIKGKKAVECTSSGFYNIYYSKQSYSTPFLDSSRINLSKCTREDRTEKNSRIHTNLINDKCWDVLITGHVCF